MIGYEAGPILLPMWVGSSDGETEWTEAFGFDLGDCSAGDVLAVFFAPYRCVIEEVGLVVTDTIESDQASPVIYYDVCTTAQWFAGITEDGDVGSITLTEADAEGKILYDVAGKGTDVPGGSVILVSLQTAASDSGTAEGDVKPYVLVHYVPEVNANLTAKTETA